MPKRKYTGLAPPRRKTAKTKRSESVVSVPRGVYLGKTPLRRSTTCEITFHKRQALSGTLLADQSANYIYRLNGAYDPEVALGGGQPRGWDQLSALYQEYVVTHAEVECWFSGDSSGSSGMLPFLAIRPDSAGTLPNNDIFEGPDRVIAKRTVRAGGATNGGDSMYLKIAVDNVKYLCNRSVDQDAMRSSVAAVPSDQVILFAGVMNTTNGSKSLDIDMNVVIRYKVKFLGPKDPGTSS